MKVKVYKVSLKKDPSIWYLVDAPSKRVARWCGIACYDQNYVGFLSPKDMKVEKFTYEEN
jgi:hypothetical protein